MRLSRLPLLVAVASVWLAAFGVPLRIGRDEVREFDGRAGVPAPADPDGSAAAMLTLRPASGQVCVAQRNSNIDAPIAMHIHRGAAGVAGPILVDLTPTLTGSACVTANMTTVAAASTATRTAITSTSTPGRSPMARSAASSTRAWSGARCRRPRVPRDSSAASDAAGSDPGPGDADGRGSVFIDLKPAAGQVCVDERYQASPTRCSSCTSTTVPRASGCRSLSTSRRRLNGGPRCVTPTRLILKEVR